MKIKVKPTVDLQLQQQIHEKFAAELKELEEAGEKPPQVDRQSKMKLRIGNLHEDCEAEDADRNNIHKWTVYVRIKNEDLLNKCSQFISKVRLELHESMKPPIVEIDATDG